MEHAWTDPDYGQCVVVEAGHRIASLHTDFLGMAFALQKTAPLAREILRLAEENLRLKIELDNLRAIAEERK